MSVRRGMENEYVDVLIVGAGISGIGAAVHLTKRCPGKTFQIVESRDDIGGTWDLFRYPGIRSDSDMYTLGYNFKPWTSRQAIADGPNIMTYLRETVEEHGVAKQIRFHCKVMSANWSSDQAMWSVEIAHGDGSKSEIRCRFLFMCSGYYDYQQVHDPEFAGRDDFAGQIIHPQFWPEDLDYTNKKVVVIGSGATAVTVVPAMANSADHVTMLQRSPSYVASRPGVDKLALFLRKILPANWAYGITRWRNVLLQLFFFNLARKRPKLVKKRLLDMIREELGPDYDMTHFTPRYNPWDERLCAVPDSDLFDAINSGKASVVTDHIERFIPDGIQLKSGKVLEADIIVTATGLKLSTGGNAGISVDGVQVDFGETINYNGVMFSGVPNLGMTFGYTNSSWTLKADLTSEYVCRLLNHMDDHGYDCATPTLPADGSVEPEPLLDFSSGYVQRALADLPKQGQEKPWRLNQNYALDIINLRYRKIDDGALVFGKASEDIDQSHLEAA